MPSTGEVKLQCQEIQIGLGVFGGKAVSFGEVGHRPHGVLELVAGGEAPGQVKQFVLAGVGQLCVELVVLLVLGSFVTSED